MDYVLWIGDYGHNGLFKSENWTIFMNWVLNNCEMISLCSDLSEQDIFNLFKEDISSFYMLEDDHNTFDLLCNEQVIKKLVCWEYSIDQNNISHMYFLKEKKEIASLIINDYDCFAIFKCDLDALKELRKAVNSKLNNEMCIKYKEDVDDMSAQWEAL